MPFPAWIIEKQGDSVAGRLAQLTHEELPPGEVLIRVEASSLNYKDALAAAGHPGVVRKFPHVPGIDAAGRVEASDSPEFSVGDCVLVTGRELGVSHYGGWAGYIRVPADWAVPLPAGLSLREAMALGTAGFTAGQCVDALVRHDVSPAAGPVLVTGATGGVGSLAVAILAKLGYRVAALTGKAESHEWLRALGASEILSREEFTALGDRPLLKAQFAGGVDTVGGETLSRLMRSLEYRGCVAACGMVGGDELRVSVFPFILRGVTLVGIDSAACPREPRLEIWRKLAGEWKPDGLDRLTETVPLAEIESQLAKIRRGGIQGRVVVLPWGTE